MLAGWLADWVAEPGRAVAAARPVGDDTGYRGGQPAIMSAVASSVSVYRRIRRSRLSQSAAKTVDVRLRRALFSFVSGAVSCSDSGH